MLFFQQYGFPAEVHSSLAVYFTNLNSYFVTLVNDIFNLFNVPLGQLRNVHEPFFSGKYLYERAEI